MKFNFNVLNKVKNSLFANYLLFSVISALISVITIVLLTKFLSTDEFGKFGLLMTLVYFSPSIISFCLESLQPVNIINLDIKSYEKFRNEYISFVLLIFLLLILFSSFFLYNIFYYKLVIFSLFIGFFQWLSSIHNNELLQRNKSVLYGILNVFSSVLLLLLSFIFLYYFQKKWESRAFAILFTELFIVIIRLYFVSEIFAKFKFVINKSEFKNFYLFGYPLLISVIPGWILNQLDKYIILKNFDFQKVGYYTFAASVSGVIVLISHSLQKSIRPIIYNELLVKSNVNRLRREITKYCFFIIVFSFIIGIIFVLLLTYFKNFKYSNARYVIFLQILSQGFFSIYSIFVMILEYYKFNTIKSKIIWQSAFIFVLINLLFGFSFYTPSFAILISFIFLSTKTYFSVKEYF